MKKSILAIVLAIATLVTFIVPAAAYDYMSWVTKDKCEVAEHTAALITETDKDGNSLIVVDGERDDYYRDNGGKPIVNYDEESWKRPAWNDYPDIQDAADASFEAYIAVDPTGFFIYAEIQDTTFFPEEENDGDPNQGDMFQIYLDWTEPSTDPMYNLMHPSPKAMYNHYLLENQVWDSLSDYKATIGGATDMMYLGWISIDYRNTIMGCWGFQSLTSLGENADKEAKWFATKSDSEDYWVCEIFIPWRDESQGERVAKGEQFHCGIGIQVGDDSDINHVVDYKNTGRLSIMRLP